MEMIKMQGVSLRRRTQIIRISEIWTETATPRPLEVEEKEDEEVEEREEEERIKRDN